MGTLAVAMVAGERFSQLRTTSVHFNGVNISKGYPLDSTDHHIK